MQTLLDWYAPQRARAHLELWRYRRVVRREAHGEHEPHVYALAVGVVPRVQSDLEVRRCSERLEVVHVDRGERFEFHLDLFVHSEREKSETLFGSETN